MADFPSLREQLDDLDRRFGKGRTYSAEERKLILDRVVTEPIVRGARFGSPALKARCLRHLEEAKALHAAVIREIPVGKEVGGG